MMAGIRGIDTRPELQVRRHLHARGLRFRLHAPRLPGRPDLVLPRHRAVVFVHGCFWHRHPGCRYAYRPKSNEEFWETKLEGNAERDRRDITQLQSMGWRVFVIWECETSSRKLDELADALADELLVDQSPSPGSSKG
jgi:DNA mismatch endonuclease (patch repair protein)